MDAQVAEAQRQELRSFTKKFSFVGRCQSLHNKQQSLWHSLDLDFEADDSEFTSALDLMLLQQKSNRCISAPLTELPQLYRGRMHWTQRLPNPKKTKFSSCWNQSLRTFSMLPLVTDLQRLVVRKTSNLLQKEANRWKQQQSEIFSKHGRHCNEHVSEWYDVSWHLRREPWNSETNSSNSEKLPFLGPREIRFFRRKASCQAQRQGPWFWKGQSKGKGKESLQPGKGAKQYELDIQTSGCGVSRSERTRERRRAWKAASKVERQRQRKGQLLTKSVVACFLAMVRGMTAEQLVQHFSCGKSLPGFYVYDPASRIAFTPADCFSEVPCPIEFIARYHPKHVFESRSSPTISELNKAVARWEHRTRWWIYHKLQGDNCFSEGGWSWLEDRKLKRNFPCNHPLPVEWDRFFAIFRACALEKCRAVRSKLSNRRRSISNLNGVVRLGLLMLAEKSMESTVDRQRWWPCLVWSRSTDRGYQCYLGPNTNFTALLMILLE